MSYKEPDLYYVASAFREDFFPKLCTLEKVKGSFNHQNLISHHQAGLDVTGLAVTVRTEYFTIKHQLFHSTSTADKATL